MSRIAIISVHGVGSPPAYSTARGVADLLMQFGSLTHSGSIPDAAPVSYPKFTENYITVATSPLVVPASAGGDVAYETHNVAKRFTRRITQSVGERDRTRFAIDDATADMDIDVAFMRDLLNGYESERDPYDTIELIGTRERDTPSGRVTDDVHIFEMHWSDLSTVGTGAARVLGALYQLILHLAHLGRKTLDLAAEASARRPKEDGECEAWRDVALWQAWVLRVFTVGVPVFTMLLVMCFLMFIPQAIPARNRVLVATALLGAVSVGVFGMLAYFRKSSAKPATQLIVAIFLAIVAVVAVNYYRGPEEFGSILLFLTVLLLGGGAYVLILYTYDESAPGALRFGLIGFGAVVIGGVVYGPGFAQSAEPLIGERLRFVALAAFEVSYLLLMTAWTVLWIVAGIAGWHMIRLRRLMSKAAFRPHETMIRTTRALWTAKVTLAISMFSFVVTALVGYRAANELAWRIHAVRPGVTPATQDSAKAGINIYPMLREGAAMPLVTAAMVPPRAACPATPAGHAYDPAACPKYYFDAFIAASGTAGLPVAMTTAVICLILISWFVALVAVTSIHKPKSQSRYSNNVGEWITDGFSWIHIAGTVLVLGLGLALTWGFVVAVWIVVTGDYPPLNPAFFLHLDNTNGVITWLAYALLASAATLAAARARLAVIASSARPALGIALDVDNYLRESPSYGTPRARIAERFGSLLTYVTDRKDANGKPWFDRILIVSHSQGTVISADFLRFLTLAGVSKPDVTAQDLRLITMGCPLRQLYSVHFPHLYDWVDRTDDYGDGVKADDDSAFAARGIHAPDPIVPPDGANNDLDQLSPSPGWLRVSQWTNLFTAGDYVGRPLWQRDSTPGIWQYDPFSGASFGLGRRERCLGDGTHTRYWTSCDVAQEIDAQLA